MRIHEILTEEQLDEINWRKGLATGAMALGALGAMGQAQGRVSMGPDGQTTPSFAQQVAQQGAQASAEKPGSELPNRELDTAEKVERTDYGFLITHNGKEYRGVEISKDGPTPRGAKMISVQQAQMGFRGIGSYKAALLPDGKAYIYSK